MYSHPSGALRPRGRLLVPGLIAAFLLSLSAERPEPVNAAGATSQTIVALVSHVAGLAAKLTTAERRLIPTLTADIAKLKSDAARAASTNDARLTASVLARLNTLSRKLVGLPADARQDEFGVRTEPDLGNPDCLPADAGGGYCAGNGWLSTRSVNWVNMKKHSFLDSGFEYPQGVRVNASFVAERADTVMAAIFSAEAYLKDDVAGSGKRMFVRALLDGKTAKPGDVVFATTGHQGLRQFMFTAVVAAGIHTVEMQWMVDDGTTGYLSDANILVRTGRNVPSDKGTLAAITPPSGNNIEKTTPAWSDVPGMNLWFWAPKEAVTTITFTAEAFVLNGRRIAVRALIDNAVIQPSDVVFAEGSDRQTRGFTFGRLAVPEGWHSAKVQWSVEADGPGYLGDRSMAVASYPSFSFAPTHPFVAAPSGPSLVLPVNGIQPLIGMSTPIVIPATGNGEVAVIFSAEVVSTAPADAMLGVDGVFLIDTLVHLTDGTIDGQVKSYVLEAKILSPGNHTLQIFVGGAAGITQFGDRTIAVTSETGHVPDLAEAPQLTGGRVLTKNIGGIEPLLGAHNVLTIMYDPHACADPADPACVNSSDLTSAEVTAAMYGAGESVNNYFKNNSGNRFSITNAGVLGPYQSAHPVGYYNDGAWDNCNFNGSGFSSRHAARLTDAVLAAKNDIDFSKFDRNRDGEIDNHELAIIVVFPAPNGDGSSLAELLSAQCPGAQRLTLNNVVLPRWINGWYTSLDDTLETYQFSTAAHELMHQFSALDDIYVDVDHATFPRSTTLMSQNRRTSTHLDPVTKLGLGWVTPRLVDDDLQIGLTNVESSNKVLVLPRYNGPANGEEYYVIENRKQDAGPGLFDDAILDSGIAVWHAIDDRTEAAKHPIGVTQTFWDSTAAGAKEGENTNGTMGRWGIRLLRPWVALTTDGVAVFPDADNSGNPDKDDTLWDKSKYTLKSAACPALFLGEKFAAFNVLAWADCTASGYGVQFLSAPANTMTVKISH